MPWDEFFSSGSVWLLSLQYRCLSYGFWFYVTWLPDVHPRSVPHEGRRPLPGGALAGLPLFLAGISVYLTGKVTPWLVARVGSAAQACGACWARSAAASPD